MTVSQVDENLKPIAGTEKEYSCDTVILSVGLIPENELSIDAGIRLDTRTRGAIVDEHFQTSQKGFFAAGNVLHVHDLVDFVSLEAEKLARSAAEYIQNGSLPPCGISVKAGFGINHTVPQLISGQRKVTLSMRVNRQFRDCAIFVKQKDAVLACRQMKKALPAEMIQIPLPENAVRGTEEIEVSVVC